MEHFSLFTNIDFILTKTQVAILLLGSYIAIVLARLMVFVVWNLIKEMIPLNDILKKYSRQGSDQCWAVITGATDGIGLGFAEQLTKLGFDICLISRNQEKLEKTVENLQQIRPQQFKQKQFKTIQFDFKEAQNLQALNQKILKEIQNLDVGIFVNNVGTSIIKPYEDSSLQQIRDVVNVNCLTMSLMCAPVLKQMKKRQSCKSALINLSSFAGQGALPYISLYSSTKAFNTFLSEAVALENPQVDILSVRPMYVESPLSRMKKGFNIPDRRQCAYACLKELRWEYETNGYFLHRIFAKIVSLQPKWLIRMVGKQETQKVMQKEQKRIQKNS